MILFKRSQEIISYLKKTATEGLTIGFVPTMGALHPGHISLINECRKSHSVTVSSIFVNPAQFNKAEDFKKYPVTLENDIYLLEKNGCDVLFLPSVEEMYPEGNKIEKHYELGYLETILEGKYRPGHFQGVCKVVERLLNIIDPTSLFAGQKDYQQSMVLKRLLILMNSPIDLIIGSTMREADGLAMSSRNIRLDKEDRKKAPEIYKVLNFIKNNVQHSNLTELKRIATGMLIDKGFKVDYVEIANAADLKSVENRDGNSPPLVALIAAFLNEVRLIDNLLVTD